LWKISSEWAANQDFHNYDRIVLLPNADNDSNEVRFAKSELDSLQMYPLKQFSDSNKTDLQMIENLINSFLFSINELKSSIWNPSHCNVCRPFTEILNGT
jgi:hypothetical protein